MSILIGIGAVGAAASTTNWSLCGVFWAGTSLGNDAWRRWRQNRRNRTIRRWVFLHNGTSCIDGSWRSSSSYGCHRAPFPAPKHTTISKHNMQQFYVVKTRKHFIYQRLYDHLGHNASTNCRAWWSPVVMVVQPMQSVGGNNDSTYTSFMSPPTAHALGLPCRQCSGMLWSGWKWGLIRLWTNHDLRVVLRLYWCWIGHGDPGFFARIFLGHI